mgnify:FL=1
MAFNAEDWIAAGTHFNLKAARSGKVYKVVAKPYMNRYRGRGGKKWQWHITQPGSQFSETVRIPMTSKTNPTIPLDTLGARLWEINQGSATGAPRNPHVDAAIKASLTTNPKSKDLEDIENTLQWYLLPNETDLDLIDVPGSLYMPPKGANAMPIILGATQEEEDWIHHILKNSLSTREQRLIRNLNIEVRSSPGATLAGFYRSTSSGPNFHGRKAIGDPDLIVVGKNYLKSPSGVWEDDTALHEILHFLRNRDPERLKDPVNRAARGYGAAKDKDLEESFTDLETVVRSSGLAHKKRAGYYPWASQPRILAPVSKQLLAEEKKKKEPWLTSVRALESAIDGTPHGLEDKERKQMYDRMLSKKKLTRVIDTPDILNYPKTTLLGKGHAKKDLQWPRPEFIEAVEVGHRGEKVEDPIRRKNVDEVLKPIKGKRAIKRTNEIYPFSVLSSAKIHGKNEAVDNYFVHKNKEGEKVSTHIYSPQAILSSAQLRALGTPPLAKKGGKLSEWKDGKLVKSSAPKNVERVRSKIFNKGKM